MLCTFAFRHDMASWHHYNGDATTATTTTKQNQPTRNENEPKQHKSRKQAFSNRFLKGSFFWGVFLSFFFFLFLLHVLEFMRMPYNEAAEILPSQSDPPTGGGCGSCPSPSGAILPGRTRAAREEMAMSGWKRVTGEPLVCLKYSLLHTSVQVSPIY